MTAPSSDHLRAFAEDAEPLELTPDLISKLRQTASSRSSPVNTFARRFDHAAAQRCQAQWWRDLLSLWRPAGVPSGDDGLRLAVRNGYLNFYRLGQSVGRVEVKRGELVCFVHAKYVRPESRNELGHWNRWSGRHIGAASRYSLTRSRPRSIRHGAVTASG